jgi:hypothetical protein
VAAGVSALDDLIAKNDLEGLLGLVEDLGAAGAWSDLDAVRHKARRAAETGRQLWPAASVAEYRLALDAPGRWAAEVLVDGAGRLAPGPLSEVAASTKTWAELSPHLPAGPVRTYVAHERVLRGEDLRDDATIDTALLDTPLVLCAWEPQYEVAEYHANGLVPANHELPISARREVLIVDAAEPIGDPDGLDALRECVAPWLRSSNGRADVVCVEGDARSAVAALGVRTARFERLDAHQVMSLLASTAASGGAMGRRRGMAFGRFHAWWTVVALAGEIDRWPLPSDDVLELLDRMTWWHWDAAEPLLGWSFHLAIEDEDEGLAWAISAADSR